MAGDTVSRRRYGRRDRTRGRGNRERQLSEGTSQIWASYFTRKRAEGFRLRVKRDDAEYWARSSVPVIVVVYDPEGDAGYWLNVTAHVREVGVEAAARGGVPIPWANVFGEQCKDELARNFPGPRVGWRRISRSIPPTGRAIGRKSDVDELQSLLTKKRMLSIVGLSGIGKSVVAALVLEGAKAKAEHPPLIWLSVDEDTTIWDIAGTILTELELASPEPEIESSAHASSRLVEALSSREAFIVLDGMEALVDSRTGRLKSGELPTLVRDMLQTDLAANVILTSTARIRTEQGLEVPAKEIAGLRPADAARLLQALGVDGRPGELLEAARRVRGHPLALELIAQLSLRAGRLSDVLSDPVVWVGDGAGIARNVLGKLYQSLDDLQKQALAAIAVCRLPIRAESALAIVGSKPDTRAHWLHALATLVDASLLSTREGTYLIHPLVRQHVLASGGSFRELHSKAGEFFGGVAFRLHSMPLAIESHYHFLQADRKKDAAHIAEEIAGPLLDVGANEVVIDLIAPVGPTGLKLEQRARLQTYLARAYYHLGDVSHARSLYVRAWQLAQKCKSSPLIAMAASNYSAFLMNCGGEKEAVTVCQIGKKAAREAGDALLEAANTGNLGSAYLKLGDRARAVALLEEALSIQREQNYAAGQIIQLNKLAVMSLEEGDSWNGEGYLREALELAKAPYLQRRRGEILVNLGHIYETEGMFGQAIDHLREAAKLLLSIPSAAPEALDLCLIHLAQVMLRVVDLPLGMACSFLAKDYAHMRQNKDVLQRADALIRGFQKGLSEDGYSKLLHQVGDPRTALMRFLDEPPSRLKMVFQPEEGAAPVPDLPEDPIVWSDSAASLLQSKGDNPTSEALLRHALDRDPTLAVAWHNLSCLMRMRQSYRSAGALARKACSLNPGDADFRRNLAELTAANGRSKEAMQLFRDCEASFSTDCQFLEIYLDVALDADDWDATTVVFDRLKANCAEAAFLKNPRGLARIARALRLLGQTEEALTVIARVVKDYPDEEVAQAEHVAVELTLGHVEEGLSQARANSAANPKSVLSLVVLAQAQREAGELREALRTLSRAKALEPRDHDVIENIGDVEALLGHSRRGLKLYKLALELEPACWAALTSLGELLLKLGDRGSAEGYLRRAHQLQPHYSELRRVVADFGLTELIS